MKTKTFGNLGVQRGNGWEQNYIWSTSKKDWEKSSYTPYVTYMANGEISTIAYDDTKRKGKMYRTRYCHHTVDRIASDTNTSTYYTNSSLTAYKDFHSGGLYSVNPLVIPNVSTLHAEALQFFKSGCVEKELDLAVDFIEWKQIAKTLPDLVTSWKKFDYHLSNFIFDDTKKILEIKKYLPEETFNRLLKAYDKKNLSKLLLKDIANAHLFWSFGVKPLISDVKAIASSIMALNERVAWLRKNQGKPVKVKFSQDLSKDHRPSDIISSNVYNQEIRTHYMDYRCMYSAYALVIYDVSGLSDLELELRVLTRQFGFDDPLAIVWEVIPYSFVVDWLLKVGDFLSSLTPKITLPMRILDSGWSVRIEQTLEHYNVFKWPRHGDTVDHNGYIWQRLYHREPGLPISFSSIDTGDPGLSQLALAFSLSMQKYR